MECHLITSRALELCVKGPLCRARNQPNLYVKGPLHQTRIHAKPISAAVAQPSNVAGRGPGLVLGLPNPATNPWDANGASSPAVVKLLSGDREVYCMYYYGRPGKVLGCGVDADMVSGVPFGWIGQAQSTDGLTWTRINGKVNPPGGEGAVFGPSEEAGTFDRVAVGVGDVVARPDGSVWMYYFGYNNERDTSQGEESTSLGFCIGLATSTDGGLTFSRRREPVLEPGSAMEWDTNFVGWPKVIPPENPGEKWFMSYHGMGTGTGMGVGVAVSDDGIKWEKIPGPVLCGGPQGTFDSRGPATRHVVKIGGKFVMTYEGFMKKPDAVGYPYLHQIGLAESSDGVSWEKCMGVGKDPGGPIVTIGEPGTWDDFAVGTPHVVVRGDELLMYYVGFDSKEAKAQIGLAVGNVNDLSKWEKPLVPSNA